uniref:MobC family plasmid mobilization relaxosome protein n=1 Tax=Aeromonas sp. Ne-1 TaxID=1675689 RepID=UPI001F353830|nr:MobC family plasmid mobilization relaxosome protein [Aeromonas sp. Ne-1]
MAKEETPIYSRYFKFTVGNLIKGAVVLGEKRKEGRQVKFRVSDLEFERLEQMAKDFQMSVPAFVKAKAQGARMRPPKIDREGAFEIARQLRGIGNNVNQLTRRANEGKAIPQTELQGIQKELQELWQQLSSALQK